MFAVKNLASYGFFGALALATAVGCGGGSGQSELALPSIDFRGVGMLPGDLSSQANAVSADGSTVVGVSTSVNVGAHAYRWNAVDGLRAIEGMTGSVANGVSADGTVVVGVGDADGLGRMAFRFTTASGMVTLTPLPGASLCQATGVSGAGNVVAGTCITAGNAAFRWTPETSTEALPRFGAGSNASGTASAVSHDGNTIVGAGHPVLTGALAWRAETVPTVLGLLPGNVSAAATCVSRDGNIIAGYSVGADSQLHAFRWTQAGGMSTIETGSSGLSNPVAAAVSGDGSVVVGWGSAAGLDAAFIWDAQHGMRRLDALLASGYRPTLSGWTLLRATGISDDGRTMVGNGVNPNGQSEGWVLRFL